MQVVCQINLWAVTNRPNLFFFQIFNSLFDIHIIHCLLLRLLCNSRGIRICVVEGEIPEMKCKQSCLNIKKPLTMLLIGHVFLHNVTFFILSGVWNFSLLTESNNARQLNGKISPPHLASWKSTFKDGGRSWLGFTDIFKQPIRMQIDQSCDHQTFSKNWKQPTRSLY